MKVSKKYLRHRLTHEGNWDRFTIRLEHLKNAYNATYKRVEALHRAWVTAESEFPPIPGMEIPPMVKVGKRGPDKGKRKEVDLRTPPPLPEGMAAEIAKLPDTKRQDVLAMFLWVNDHPAMIRRPVRGFVQFKLSDLEGCPTRGAWNLLRHYANDQKEFFKLFAQKVLISKTMDVGEAKEGAEAGAVDDEVGDLKSVLGDLL